MEKRYQVFISSTFTDLAIERQKVIQTIMELDCIPSGMETFPAIDEEQFKFIKRVISDCDYYILIIGARYGSLSSDGISYTEKEYDFAIEKKINVLTFIHGSPGSVSFDKSEATPEQREKLDNFRVKASTSRLVKYWTTPEELQGLVATSLSRTIKIYPAMGWVRASYVSNTEVLTELNEQRKLNAELVQQVADLKIQIEDNKKMEIPVNLKKDITIKGTQYIGYRQTWEISTTWEILYYLISPILLEMPNDNLFQKRTNKAIEDYFSLGSSVDLNEDLFQTIKLQFEALDLFQSKYSTTTKGGSALFWRLTEKGKKVMFELRTSKF